MSRSRASTVFAAIATAVAIAAATVMLTPVAASAAPEVHYPPPPPSLVVNHGVVKYGTTVHATGTKYTGRERVSISVLFTPKGSHRARVVKTATLYTDRRGTFFLNLRMAAPGIVVIRATGRSSHKTASAYVTVTDRRQGTGGWVIKKAAFTSALSSPGTAGPSSTAPAGDAGLAIAGLGVLALAGSAAVTHQLARRRRRAAVAA